MAQSTAAIEREPEAPAKQPSLIAEPELQLSNPADLLSIELRILTAEEVASVLRVDTGQVITSISSGELPGNRIGSHWRVDRSALVRWLQGTYGDLARNDPNG